MIAYNKKKSIISLCPEKRGIVQKFVRANKYHKHCIVRAKIIFTKIFLIMKILIISNKNLHNKNLHSNKLYNGLVTRVHFLEISLKFKYF